MEHQMFGRLWRGLPLNQALERWTDPDQLRALQESEQRSRSDDPAVARAAEQRRAELRVSIEQKLLAKLINGTLQASAFQLPISASSSRETIMSDVWELLDDVDFAGAEARGRGLTFIKVEVYSPPPPLIPRIALFDRRSLDEAEPEPPEFEHSQDYTNVRIGEHTFEFEGFNVK